MLLRQMKYFVSVVDTGSFTEAAEQNYISQSAISQQIAALEGELGVKLFVRSGRKFRLTPAGEYFYGRSRALLKSADDIVAETRRRSDGSRIARTYCAFWQKRRTNYYIEKFASILRRQFSKS